MKKMTIKEIAQRAGVSIAAVSYVLNGKKGVGEETAARIRRVMEDANYHVNLNSRRLVTGKSYNVHAVIRRDAAPACKAFYQEVILALIEETAQKKYNLLSTYQMENGNDAVLIASLENSNTDGMIFFQGIHEDVYRALKKYCIPAVIVNPGFDPRDVPAVWIDFEELSYRATAYLCQNGHREIAFLGMCALPSFFEASFAGFCRALDEAHCAVHPDWVLSDLLDETTALERSRALFCQKRRPTAAFCAQDVFAVCCAKAAAEKGLRVPDDISLIGIDDMRMVRFLTPGLTTVRIDAGELARVAVDMLFAQMAGETVNSVTLPPGELIVRDSVKKISG